MDADAAILGGQIIDIFKQIGFNIIDRRMTDGSIGGIALGILVSGSNQALRDAIIMTFNQVGLKSTVGSPPPAAGIFVGDPNETGDVNIFIGVKPPV
ncbi:hypothetical protein [Methylobacterium sp. ap11]|uniref:hypothetical protein n=1 Tax=Methylobacterium sp. ap11 TaxID=1761799 RepID=UPI001160C71D|nr:hypothetical protein [Methylobacterium sp. ap11]